MAETSKVPSMPGDGNIAKVLGKIKTAAVLDRFTIDFLSTKLGLSSGTARPVIPFLKRAGFLHSDGSPSERYREFRNDSLGRGPALCAHCSPLSQDEVVRLKLAVRDWFRLMESGI